MFTSYPWLWRYSQLYSMPLLITKPWGIVLGSALMGFMGVRDKLWFLEQLPSRVWRSGNTMVLPSSFKVTHNKHSLDIHATSNNVFALEWPMKVMDLSTLHLYLITSSKISFPIGSQSTMTEHGIKGSTLYFLWLAKGNVYFLWD